MSYFDKVSHENDRMGLQTFTGQTDALGGSLTDTWPHCERHRAHKWSDHLIDEQALIGGLPAVSVTSCYDLSARRSKLYHTGSSRLTKRRAASAN